MTTRAAPSPAVVILTKPCEQVPKAVTTPFIPGSMELVAIDLGEERRGLLRLAGECRDGARARRLPA